MIPKTRASRTQARRRKSKAEKTSRERREDARLYDAARFANPRDVLTWFAELANIEIEGLEAGRRRRLSDELLILAQYTAGAQAPERELGTIQMQVRLALTALLPPEEGTQTSRRKGPPSRLRLDEAARLRERLLALAARLKPLLIPEQALYEVQRQARSILESLVEHDDQVPLARGEPTSTVGHVDELVVSFQWERDGDEITEQILSTELRSGVLMRLRDAIVGLRKKFRLRRCRVPENQGICGRFFVPSKRQIYCRLHPDVMREERRQRNRGTRQRLLDAKTKARRSRA